MCLNKNTRGEGHVDRPACCFQAFIPADDVHFQQAPGGIATPQVYAQLLALYLLHNDM